MPLVHYISVYMQRIFLFTFEYSRVESKNEHGMRMIHVTYMTHIRRVAKRLMIGRA